MCRGSDEAEEAVVHPRQILLCFCIVLLLTQGLDVAPNVVARLRVKADCGLVEKKNPRLVQQRARHFEPPFHAAGILLHEVVSAVPEPDQFEQHLLSSSFFPRHWAPGSRKSFLRAR